jgi:hypothetical protein
MPPPHPYPIRARCHQRGQLPGRRPVHLRLTGCRQHRSLAQRRRRQRQRHVERRQRPLSLPVRRTHDERCSSELVPQEFGTFLASTISLGRYRRMVTYAPMGRSLGSQRHHIPFALVSGRSGRPKLHKFSGRFRNHGEACASGTGGLEQNRFPSLRRYTYKPLRNSGNANRVY